MKKYSVIDLFSGCGGMSTGFHRNGNFTIIGAVDFEKSKPSLGPGSTSCNLTYERNIGIKPLFEDLSLIEPEKISNHFGVKKNGLDILISCAPCTGFSQKQSRNHIEDDPRNLLVERTAIFVHHFMPMYLVMENVKELAKGKHRHHLQNLLSKLDELGYKVTYEIHNLSEFGLPQNRIRTLLIAKRDGIPPEISFPKSEIKKTVRDAIGHLPSIEAGKSTSSDPMHICPTISPRVLERIMAIPKNGGSWTDIPIENNHLLIPSMDRENSGSFPDIYGRLWWDKPAPTVTRECSSPGNGRYTHPEQNRLLSVREMALIQGFPEDYFFEGNLSSKYRQIGDAVPPLISSMIAELIVSDIKGKARPSQQSLI